MQKIEQKSEKRARQKNKKSRAIRKMEDKNKQKFQNQCMHTKMKCNL